ncbi:hypothetical protein XENTR_v10014701 [Xenopus tropicalis]|nr:hypothetical protein XENTR_v10014701 [Xenopus tropicalis]
MTAMLQTSAAEYVLEKVKKAEKKLEDNPYDLDARSILIREAQRPPFSKRYSSYSFRGTKPKLPTLLRPIVEQVASEKTHGIYNRLLSIEDKDPTLVYIQYMEFAWRAEGIKSGRMIFKKVREDPRTRHQVYVTAALMEYYCSKIWARFLALESNIGDLASSILNVGKRRYTAFKEEYEGKETALLVDRYKFMDMYPCSTSELKALGYKDVPRAKVAALIPDPVVAPSIAPLLKDDVDR